MSFDHLLCEALIPGKCSESENGVGFMFQPGPVSGEETILLFKLDDDLVKKSLNLLDKKCCETHKPRLRWTFMQWTSSPIVSERLESPRHSSANCALSTGNPSKESTGMRHFRYNVTSSARS